MTTKKNVSARPPIADALQRMNFIEGIEETISKQEPVAVSTKPWEKPGVRADVFKISNVRLDEVTFLKLQYVAKMKGKSVNSICVSLINEYLARELPNL